MLRIARALHLTCYGLMSTAVEQAYVGMTTATTKHSLRAALQLSPPDVQRSVTLNYSYLPVLVKLVLST